MRDASTNCARANGGDGYAKWDLAVWLARADQLDELLARMAAGDRSARRVYSDWLVRHRRIPEAIDVLRPLAALGIIGAQQRLARLLAGQGRYAEAMSVLALVPRDRLDLWPVKGWLQANGLGDWDDLGVDVRREYLDALRRALSAGDADARQQLSWIVLLRWRPRLDDAVALLDDIGPNDWLHERLVHLSRGWRFGEFRAAAVDALATTGTTAYHRTRAALLMLQGQRDAAITQLRTLVADGDRHAHQDLATILDAELPQREIRIADHPNPIDMHGIAFSPDGTALAAWGHGGPRGAQAVVWDVASGTQRHVQKLTYPWLAAVVFRADGTLDEVRTENSRRGTLSVTAPDGATRAVRAAGRIQLHSTATGELTRTIATTTHAMAFHPDGTALATADFVDDTIRLWSLAR